MPDPAQHYSEAVAAYGRRDMARALEQARAVVRQLPGNAAAHGLAGVAALQLGRLPDAIDHLREAARHDPARVDYPLQLARALVQAGDVHAAAEAQRRAVALAPHDAALVFNLATLLTFSGDLAGAVEAYEACVALDPSHWQAHLALAQSRRWSADRNHVARLRAQLQRDGGHPEARLFLGLALAKELEDQGDYPAAFAHYVEAKASHRRRHPYDPARDRAMFDALCEVVPRPGEAAGEPDERPVFVLGMPRSGTTLVDRILSSHPRVRSVGERYDFPRALKQASATPTPALLDPPTIAAARSLDWSAVGRAYLASVRPAGDCLRFVDKLPHNFLYAGFIATALPGARIVCLRRERMDTCLANFRQLLSPGNPWFDYSFDLLDTGRYVLQFERLVAHWQRAFPGRILELRYEDLVADQEAATRRLLEYCGLDWDPACLAFERNQAAVSTASAVQVREPLHRGSIGRWRHYAPQLAELEALLASG